MLTQLLAKGRGAEVTSPLKIDLRRRADRPPAGAKGPLRVSAEIEQAVLDHALVNPCHGAVRVEQELRPKPIFYSQRSVA